MRRKGQKLLDHISDIWNDQKVRLDNEHFPVYLLSYLLQISDEDFDKILNSSSSTDGKDIDSKPNQNK